METKAFRGEGEDLIAALIEASNAKPRAMNGDLRHGSIGRDLVPFDFVSGGARESEANDGATSSRATIPAPKSASSGKGANKGEMKAIGNGKKGVPTPRATGNDVATSVDPRVRANKVFEPQKTTLTAKEQVTVLSRGMKKGDESGSTPKGKVATVNERWANSSFQNAPAPDQLPMPTFFKESPLASEPPRAAVAMQSQSPAALRMPQSPASAEGLKNLLGVQGAPSSPATARAPSPAKVSTRVPSGHALFNDIMSSASGGAPPAPPTPQYSMAPLPPTAQYAKAPAQPTPQYAKAPAHSTPLYAMPSAQQTPHYAMAPTHPTTHYATAPMPPQYAPTPMQYAQQTPVQHKLNALFGFNNAPAQPYPPLPTYPTAPESSDFHNLMAKLNAGRV